MTEKLVNYTETQTTELVNAYVAGETVESLAERLGRSTRSIVAKLSREGVYKPKSKAKAGARTTKADLVARLVLAANVAPEVLESLEKADKGALEALVAAFADIE